VQAGLQLQPDISIGSHARKLLVHFARRRKRLGQIAEDGHDRVADSSDDRAVLCGDDIVQGF